MGVRYEIVNCGFFSFRVHRVLVVSRSSTYREKSNGMF